MINGPLARAAPLVIGSVLLLATGMLAARLRRDFQAEGQRDQRPSRYADPLLDEQFK